MGGALHAGGVAQGEVQVINEALQELAVFGTISVAYQLIEHACSYDHMHRSPILHL